MRDFAVLVRLTSVFDLHVHAAPDVWERRGDDVAILRSYAEAGFAGTEVAPDRAGLSAIVRNAEGRMMLVRAHGNHFAARPVDAATVGRLDKEFLTLTMPE